MNYFIISLHITHNQIISYRKTCQGILRNFTCGIKMQLHASLENKEDLVLEWYRVFLSRMGNVSGGSEYVAGIWQE